MEHLIDTYQNLIFTICYKFTSNYFDAEDIAQETFLSAYKNLSSFDGKNEKAWIAKIATNKCIDFRRKSSNNQVPTEDEYFVTLVDTGQSVEEKCSDRFIREQLLKCCESLKPPYDAVAKEYFYEELSFEEIAKKHVKNEKTIQTQVYRAKAMLRKIYGKEENKDEVFR